MNKLKYFLACTTLTIFTSQAQALEINTSPLLTGLSAIDQSIFLTANVLFESKSGKFLFGPTTAIGLNRYEQIYGLGYRLEYNAKQFYIANGQALLFSNSSSHSLDLEYEFSYLMSGIKVESSNIVLKFGVGLISENITFFDDMTFGFEIKLGYKL
ncbi:hypothetical protein [Marinicellulosiphila megalodicopiae]|uniref:hypothetical protein n=1 Tax=Marinicellulosiphila megalodicopiae TaxID=2724896 RepID=UPI003BAFFAA8